jgi:hypothetical protein
MKKGVKIKVTNCKSSINKKMAAFLDVVTRFSGIEKSYSETGKHIPIYTTYIFPRVLRAIRDCFSEKILISSLRKEQRYLFYIKNKSAEYYFRGNYIGIVRNYFVVKADSQELNKNTLCYRPIDWIHQIHSLNSIIGVDLLLPELWDIIDSYL